LHVSLSGTYYGCTSITALTNQTLSIDRSIDLSIYHPVLNAISIYNNVVDYFNALDSLFIYWDVQTWGLVDNHSGYHHVRMLNHVEPPFLKLDPSFCWYYKTKIVDS
jgi:hypothetical protein